MFRNNQDGVQQSDNVENAPKKNYFGGDGVLIGGNMNEE